MRFINAIVLMSVVFSMTIAVFLQPVFALSGGDRRSFYDAAIKSIAANCEKKECLGESRSAHLRRCADAAAKKAEYLRHNKQRLIEAMTAEELPLKRYRVERYVNMSLSDDLQAKP